MSKKHESKPGEGKKARRQAKQQTAPFGEGKVAKSKSVKGPVVEAKVEAPALPPLPKMPSASRSRKPKPLHECKCGCGGTTTGIWVPGHDARARGWAIRIERGVCTMKDVPENERPGAKFFLELRKQTGEGSGNMTVIRGGKKAKKEAVAEVAPANEPVAEPTDEAANQ